MWYTGIRVGFAYGENEMKYDEETSMGESIAESWNLRGALTIGVLFQQVTMRDAVTTALTLDIFHRNCDKVKMACVAQTVNVLNALFLTDGDRFIKTPNYDVFEMYMVHRDAELLSCSCSGGCEEGSRIYTLASEKDGIISVNVVNGNYDQDEDVTIILPGAYTWHGESSFVPKSLRTATPGTIRTGYGQRMFQSRSMMDMPGM